MEPDYPFTKEAINQVLNDESNPLDRLVIKKYDYIQKQLQNPEFKINEDQEYQDKFMEYYCIKKEDRIHLQKGCFEFLEQNKKERNFGNTLKFIVENTEIDYHHRQPFLCFLCSILIHTLDPNLPVWEFKTLKYCKLDENLYKNKIGFSVSDGKINFDRYNVIYEKFKKKTIKEIQTNKFKNWKNVFNEHFKNEFNQFTDIKKLDLFFWKFRPVSSNVKLRKNIISKTHVGNALLFLREGLLLYFDFEYKNNNACNWDEMLRKCVDKFQKREIYGYITEKYNINRHFFTYEDVKNWDVMPLVELFYLIENNNYHNKIIKKLRFYRNNWAHQKHDIGINFVLELFQLIDNCFNEFINNMKKTSSPRQRKIEKINRQINKTQRLRTEFLTYYQKVKNESIDWTAFLGF